jgi:hypothetical protein
MTWTILSMTCYPQAEGQTDVVFNVYWQCFGQEVIGTDPATSRVFSGRVGGVQPVTYTAGSPYTPYDQLTQEQVLGWIWSGGVDKTAAEAQVQAQIDNVMNPPVITPPLPWASA